MYRFPLTGRALLVLLVMATAFVCGCCGHRQGAMPHARTSARGCWPCHANRVRVFVVHGIDPLDCAGLRDLCDHLRAQGYRCHLYTWLCKTSLCRDLEDALLAEPESPVAMVGFSLGSAAARDATYAVYKRTGKAPDLLFYLGGWFLDAHDGARPPFVPRVVHVLGTSCDLMGGPLPYADNLQVDDPHFSTPSNPNVVRRLEFELQLLANQACPRSN